MRAYVTWIIRHRLTVIGITAAVTLLAASQVRHLRVIVDPSTIAPTHHPYVVATNRVEELFGSKYVVVVGIRPRQGDVYQPAVLAEVQRMTAAFLDTPGVIKGSVLSLAARRAKHITGTADGLEVRPLMETVPQTPDKLEALRQAVRANPVYLNAIVSRDERTAAVIAEFRLDRRHEGYRWIADNAHRIAERGRHPGVDTMVGGGPMFTAEIERYSQRMGVLFPLAVLVTGLIHYHAFRTLQGLILPLVTALVAVIWGLGVMGVAGVPIDPFNASTPILILAVAAGHAVQILKRYYEEFQRLRDRADLLPAERNRAAVVEAIVRVGPVMLTAGGVAALSFFSLATFDVTTVRVFGVFTGLGIVSTLVLEMSFIPALRSLLRAPGERERRREREHTMWDGMTGRIADWVTGRRRRTIYVATGVLLVICGLGIARVVVDNSTRSFFFEGQAVRRDDATLNERLGGTRTLFVLVEGREDDAVKDPRVLQGLEATQRFLEREREIGKTVSLADFVKRMHRAMHGDDPAYDRIPDDRNLIAQYLLLHSMSGEPGDFDTYVDYGYRAANLWAFLKTDSTAYFESLRRRLAAFVAGRFPDGVTVSIGGSVAEQAALNEVIVRGKVQNVLQIAGVILLVTSVVFRSLLAGLLVLVPLAFAVLVNFALMGLTGMRLNVATATISAMAVGIGADYAIYVMYRFREEVGRGADGPAAARTTLATAGKAILFVASAIAGGYALLLLSWGYAVHLWFGILIPAAMLVSSFSALTILPSLILSVRPRFVFGRPSSRAAVAAAMLLAGVAAGVLGGGRGGAGPLAADEIMARNYVATRPLDSVSDATFTLINKSGQERIRTTLTTSKLRPNGADSMRMVRFLSPPDVRGTVILTIENGDRDDDIWVYLPAMKKVRRLVSENKKDSFAGTDFSYGDMIGHKVGDWTHRLLKEETIEGQRCWTIESLPRTESVKASTGYSKRLLRIRQDNFVTIRADYWDQGGQPLKVYLAADVRATDAGRGKFQAMRQETSNLQTGHRTVLTFTNFKVNQGVKDEFFTTRYMEREQ
jgi:predicted RND superfamily exporter protein/outer membrane lipoprotein-sorting protein